MEVSSNGLGADSATTAPPQVDPDLLAMTREAHRVLLNRLTSELLEAVADGDWAVPETTRLSLWLRADLLPWAGDREQSVTDPAARAALRSDRGVLIGLANLLASAHGIEAAKWARQVHRTAMVLLARLEYLEG